MYIDEKQTTVGHTGSHARGEQVRPLAAGSTNRESPLLSMGSVNRGGRNEKSGCLCWYCARFGSCKKANREIETCQRYLPLALTYADCRELLGLTEKECSITATKYRKGAKQKIAEQLKQTKLEGKTQYRNNSGAFKIKIKKRS